MPTKTRPSALTPSAATLGPETITRRELPNGVVVLARENFTSPSVVVDADLRAGALWHGREQAGLSNFTASMLMRGTERFGFDAIYEQIEAVGASLSVSGGTHTSGFYGKCLAEDLDLILGLASDALRRPVFPEDQLERLRGEWLTRLMIQANDTRNRASQAFYELAYPEHPYQVEEDGYPETIRALTRADLINFHRTHYGPRGMIVTVVGAVAAEAAVDLVARHFGDWDNPAQPPQPDLPAVMRPAAFIRRHTAMPGKAQSDVLLGGPGPARSHPRFLAARLANNILGAFGMGGHIGHTVREKNGLAYYAGSALNGGLGPGAWYAYAGVSPANVDRAVDLMQKEIAKFLSRRPAQAELEDNQAQFIGRLPLSLETNEGVAGLLGSMELYALGLDYVQRYAERIRAIDRTLVLETAREFWDLSRCVLAVAGPEAGAPAA